MMDHQTFLQSLPVAERAALVERSDTAGLRHLLGHLALIVLLGVWVMVGPAAVVALLPLGIAMVFLFCPMHEASHDTVFATQAGNRGLAWGAGLILFLPPLWFRYFHFAHHKHTHDPDHDPELSSPKPETWGGYLWYLSGLPLWWSTAKTLLRNALGLCDDPYVPVRKRGAVTREARVMLGIYAGLALGSWVTGSAVLLWIWLVPLILGQPFLRLYLLAEHTLCPRSDDMFENTRTTFTSSVVRWLAWNMPYHAEHHAFPMVPFHKLPQLHAKSYVHLRRTADGYAGFHAGYQQQLGQHCKPEPCRQDR